MGASAGQNDQGNGPELDADGRCDRTMEPSARPVAGLRAIRVPKAVGVMRRTASMSRAHLQDREQEGEARSREDLDPEVTGSLGHIDPVGVRFRVPVDDELTFAGP